MDHKWGALLVDSSDTQKAYRSAGYSVVLLELVLPAAVTKVDSKVVRSVDYSVYKSVAKTDGS